jgi:hypothetical protein
MKARIIETGEEITIIGISKEWGTVQYYGNDGIYRQRTFRDRELELLDTTESHIDWEQRRYEIAKEAMSGILSSEYSTGYASLAAEYSKNEKHTYPKAISRYAIACADALIKELKGGTK